LQGLGPNLASVTTPATASSAGGLGTEFGMTGLFALLKAEERDVRSLVVGADLTQVGLNLNSNDPLHAAFATPWAKEPPIQPLEPFFSLPSSYRMSQSSLKLSNMKKFEPATLMWIFYAMPRDMLQAHAAVELYSRDWRYHKDIKLWFRQEQPQPRHTGRNSPQPAPGGSLFFYFDINAWDRRVFNGSLPGPSGQPVSITPQQLVAGFLTEDDVKIKA
jgi:CCR4-NOT transcription complex subunit 2